MIEIVAVVLVVVGMKTLIRTSDDERNDPEAEAEICLRKMNKRQKQRSTTSFYNQ
jgi:hypothetical protein